MSLNQAVPRQNERMDATLLSLVEGIGVGAIKRYRKGETLFWQGDPVEHIFVVKRGTVKIASHSSEGKIYTYAFLGPGGLAGAAEYLLGREHDSVAEALEDSEVIAILPAKFEGMLASDRRFSPLVMHQLARSMNSLAGQVRALGFLDVQQRLKRSLMELAEQHGIATERGIMINLRITHEEIGELVAANRTTITEYLNELKQRGYLWKNGRHMVIIPPEHMDILDKLHLAVVKGNDDQIVHWTKRALDSGVDHVQACDAMADGMREVDRMLVREEIDLSDVVLSTCAMERGLAILDATGREAIHAERLGTIVIGTVRGDIHDIGRKMVAMLLTARGFRVIDLGINVATEAFLAAVRRYQPDILALSSSMSTTALEQRTIIHALRADASTQRTSVMVGGGPISQRFAAEIGSNGYAPTARGAADLAWRLINDRCAR